MHPTRDPATAVQHGVAELDMEAARVPVGDQAIGPADAAVEVSMGNRRDLQAGARDHPARARLQNVRQRAAGGARGRQRPRRDRQLNGAGRLAEARIGNVGPAFGFAGPHGSFEPFSDLSTVICTILMWLGRVEIVPVAVLLTRSYWRV